MIIMGVLSGLLLGAAPGMAMDQRERRIASLTDKLDDLRANSR